MNLSSRPPPSRPEWGSGCGVSRVREGEGGGGELARPTPATFGGPRAGPCGCGWALAARSAGIPRRPGGGGRGGGAHSMHTSRVQPPHAGVRVRAHAGAAARCVPAPLACMGHAWGCKIPASSQPRRCRRACRHRWRMACTALPMACTAALCPRVQSAKDGMYAGGRDAAVSFVEASWRHILSGGQPSLPQGMLHEARR